MRSKASSESGLPIERLISERPYGKSRKAKAKKETPSLQCERDGQLQACDDQTAVAKPKKVAAFKAQAADMKDESAEPAKKKKKKGKKTAKKKAKANVG